MSEIIPAESGGVPLAWSYRRFVPATAMEMWRSLINAHIHDGTSGSATSHDNLTDVNGPASAADAWHLSETEYNALVDGGSGDNYHTHTTAGISIPYTVYMGSDRSATNSLRGTVLSTLATDANFASYITNNIINTFPAAHPAHDFITLANLKVITAVGSYYSTDVSGHRVSISIPMFSTAGNGVYFVRTTTRQGINGYVGPIGLANLQPSTNEEAMAQYFGTSGFDSNGVNIPSLVSSINLEKIHFHLGNENEPGYIYYSVTGLGWHVSPSDL